MFFVQDFLDLQNRRMMPNSLDYICWKPAGEQSKFTMVCSFSWYSIKATTRTPAPRKCSFCFLYLASKIGECFSQRLNLDRQAGKPHSRLVLLVLEHMRRIPYKNKLVEKCANERHAS
jgi:hypothetical protein